MHGFTARAEVRTALAWIDAHAYRLANERVAVDAAADRVLAQQVIAPLDVPAFDRAAMDGVDVIEVPGAHARRAILVPRDEVALALRLHWASASYSALS